MKHRIPPPWLLALTYVMTIAAVAGSICVAVYEATEWWSYIVYIPSALLLGYTVYTLVLIIPSIKPKVLELAKRHDFTDNLVSDYAFRTSVFSMTSYILNIAFAIFNGVMGIITGSVWYGVMCAYYFALSIMRVFVFFHGRRARRLEDENKRDIAELKVFRNCGIFLVGLEVALGGALVHVLLAGSPDGYEMIVSIGSAAFAFTKIILAIYNFFKARRTKDPIVQSFRNINVTGAMVSLLATQIALTSTFSEGDKSMTVLNAVVGAAICLATVVMGAGMIVSAMHNIKVKKGEAKCQAN